MLLQLDIHNIALIDAVNIEMGSGLNILTGETGAGKSIIIDSINAILGERVSREIIRTGAEKALVEAVFKVELERFADIFDEMGMEYEEDGTLILSREITQSGRNICRVNGKMVTVSFLKRIGERLIDLHGQHDNQSLLKTENHIDLLDSFGGEAIHALKYNYSVLLGQYKETIAALKALSGDTGERERKMDLLRFQIEEIEKAKLKVNEDEDLGRRRLLLSNAEKIAGSLSMIYSLLTSGEHGEKTASDLMNEALSHFNTISRLEDSYENMSKRLQDILYQIEDLTEEIRRNREDIECNPAFLEEIDERLDLIFKFKRKYGASIQEIHQFRHAAQQQLDTMLKSEETAALLTARLKELEILLYDASIKLNAERVKAAHILENKIGKQLDDLEMKKAAFKADIQFNAASDDCKSRKYTQNGLDKVEFLISANMGEPLKPLAKIASGGEMSRIMLAIKTILAEVDKIPTMIFDEIDMGISGKAALKVGEKLSFISQGHQVICVTHLAQIASMADKHFLIEKITEDESTKTLVSRLCGKKTVDEIARLIGGAATTDTSLKYAEEMLKSSKIIRKA